MIVDFPAPEGPPAPSRFPAAPGNQLRAARACLGVGEADVFENDFAATVPDGHGAPRIGSSGFSSRMSRVRSSPAMPSVSCVPMLTIW